MFHFTGSSASLDDPFAYYLSSGLQDEILVREGGEQLEFAAGAVSVNKRDILAGWVGISIPFGAAHVEQAEQSPAVRSLVQLETHALRVVIEHLERRQVPQRLLLEQMAGSGDVRVHGSLKSVHYPVARRVIFRRHDRGQDTG